LNKFGLTPKDVEGSCRIYVKYFVLECSDAPIPSNPSARAIAVSKGLISDDKDFYNVMEDKDSVKLWAVI
jgi:hypothetical protein